MQQRKTRFLCGELGHWARDCSGNETGGQGISTSLLPHEDGNPALPAASIYVDGAKCSALIDTGCSRTLIDADRCQSWRRAIVNMMTIGGISPLCCDDGTVTVSTEEGSSAKISVLVVLSKPLGFDLMLGLVWFLCLMAYQPL